MTRKVSKKFVGAFSKHQSYFSFEKFKGRNLIRPQWILEHFEIFVHIKARSFIFRIQLSTPAIEVNHPYCSFCGQLGWFNKNIRIYGAANDENLSFLVTLNLPTRLTVEKSSFCKTHVLEHLAFIDGRLIARLRNISSKYG